ncbi:MAG: hypothetical protein L0Y56_12325 [Nitrospira sp.]|nr:hypothetical protein [Nitrospira sp.]
MELTGLVWDSFNSEHISKHGMAKAEVEEACKNWLEITETRLGRFLLVGKTDSSRWVSVVLASKGEGVYYPVTARDSSKKERKSANDQKNKK